MPRMPKFGWMKAHHTGNPRTYLEVKRSKVKVTKRINTYTAQTGSAQLVA